MEWLFLKFYLKHFMHFLKRLGICYNSHLLIIIISLHINYNNTIYNIYLNFLCLKILNTKFF